MTLDFLPPQAYTKETLLKAYNWLQSQSDAIKEMATTPDQLVSLYLKSTRLGQDPQPRAMPQSTPTAPLQENPDRQNPDRPSYQSFKSELKNLAGMMGDLEKKTTQAPPVSPSASVSQAFYQPAPNPVAATPTAAASVQAVTPTYDDYTLNMIREVKTELNLSSDMEVIRMLVKLGYQKAKTLYK